MTHAGHPDHLRDRSVAFEESTHRCLAQIRDAPPAGGARQVLGRAAAKDVGRGFGVDGEDLEDSPATPVAGVPAARAAASLPNEPPPDLWGQEGAGFLGRHPRLASTATANGAHETLGYHAHQGGPDQKPWHSEIGEPGDRSGSVVGV